MRKNNKERILLAHGSGGKLMQELIQESVLPNFKSPILKKLNDSAVFSLGNKRIAYTTDSYVVNPIFFPGGDIGNLAVWGTVNDLAMVGAQPLYLTLSLIVEEGFLRSDLERVLSSAKKACRKANTEVVGGDLKVVEKGSADKIFINTSGLGLVDKGVNISASRARSGDKVIINGYIAEHGSAILSERENLKFSTKIKSDSAPLNGLVKDMLVVSKKIHPSPARGSGIHTLRDATRGGVAAVLNEIAQASNVGILVYEDNLPVREEVRGACEMLGFDPLYVANEGKLLAFVNPGDAESVLQSMKKNPYGKNSRIIGEVVSKPAGNVFLKTCIGGTRIIDMPSGEQLPRIC